MSTPGTCHGLPHSMATGTLVLLCVLALYWGPGDLAATEPADDASAEARSPILIDGSSQDWSQVPVLLRDAVGDMTWPDSCDLESLRAATDSEYVYILLELAVGWGELFERKRSTGALGWVYLDVDDDRSTGCADTEDPHRGTEYVVYITTGYRAETGEQMVPIVAFSLACWDEGRSRWEEVEVDCDPHIAMAGTAIELRLPRRLVQLIPRQTVTVVVAEQNAPDDAEYSVARKVLLPDLAASGTEAPPAPRTSPLAGGPVARRRAVALEKAVVAGNLDRVRGLLDEGAHIGLRDYSGETRLHEAAEAGHADIAQLLVAKGADSSARDNKGKTPLHRTGQYGRQEIALLLLQNGAHVDAQDDDGVTPLQEAVIAGHFPLVELLLKRGADPDLANRGGLAPLHLAAQEAHTGMVEVLLAHGANVNTRTNDGSTPLHKAVAVVGDMFLKPAERRKRMSARAEILTMLLAGGAEVNARDDEGATPLDWAVGWKLKDLEGLLRKHGGKRGH